MRALRWIGAFLAAYLVSGLTWIALSHLVPSATGDDPARVMSYVPIAVRAFLPSAVFVVLALLICPRKSATTVFAVFALALVFAGGAIETITDYRLMSSTWWHAALAAHFAGAIVGILAFPGLRSDRANPADPAPDGDLHGGAGAH
jgi:hypothetical protein